MRFRTLGLLLVLGLVLAACAAETTTTAGEEPTGTTGTTGAAAEPLTIGMILVGPQDDHGWSQAHYEAGEYVAEKTGAELIVIDKVNPADSPDTSVEQVVDDMVAQGADIVFATSDDMKDGILAAAGAHPEVPMIWSSGDSAWEEGKAFAGLDNLGNVMGKMEYGKMIAGCAAALKTETGSIGYLGPLVNDETRRLVNAAYLGARHCWEEYRDRDPAALRFTVTWIGFWFNIPGVTLDPTQVTNDFLDGGADVIISGIDTTEAIVRVGQRASAGERVWAIPYDFEGACEEAPEVCLGVPYFNWGPAYLDIVESVSDGSFAAEFQWLDPDWEDINNPDTSIVGFVKGDGLGDAEAQLDGFIAGLASGELELWTGPLSYQDGTTFLADGEVATDLQIWYMPQLLAGVTGASSAE